MTDAFLATLRLAVDPEERALICCRCGYALAVNLSQVTSHLRSNHQVGESDRRGLTAHLTANYPDGFRSPAELPLGADGSDAHPQLRVQDGYSCRECTYHTINYPELSKHISKNHLGGQSATRGRIQHLYDDAYLQTWTRGSSRQYWRVKKDGNMIRPVVGRDASEHIRSVQERERARAKERIRIYGTSPSSISLAGTRPWMERTRWETIYHGYRRDILKDLTVMPQPFPSARHALGSGFDTIDPELASPHRDEAMIALLTKAVDHVLDRCEETMLHTGRTLLCWLRSTKPQTCYPKPFALVALGSSKKKYRRLLKRFFAFVFRAFRMPVGIRHRLLGIRFRKEQMRQMRMIWEHRAWNNTDLAHGRWSGSRDRDVSTGSDLEDEGENQDEYETDEEEKEDHEDDNEGVDGYVEEEDWYNTEVDDDDDADDGEHNAGDGGEDGGEDEHQQEDSFYNADAAVMELLELVFQLAITFSTEEFVDSQPSSSLLVYFSGIIGFSPDARSFLPAKKYTPHLSALIYIQRLLFLEHALPLRPYPHLRIPRRSRFQQHQNFDIIRQRYMITGSPTPLGEFQSLRDFGRVMARTDPPSFLLHWSDDGETVSYGDDFSLTMERFRGLAEHFLTKAEELCDNLMFGLDPIVDLKRVKDDLTDTRYGFSFVQHPANKLADAYLELSAKACAARRNGLFRENRWDWKAIFCYRKKAESLLEMIAGVFQTVGGQTARVSELFSLEYENGSSTERGLYVHNGFMIFITRHYKAKRSTNREFNVVRFLSARGGQIVFKYLVYIRPFLEMLNREQSSYLAPSMPPTPTALLFRSDHTPDKPWDSPRFTSILKKATAEVWKISANTQLYRQLTISITEKHVQKMHRPFNRFDDKSAAADVNAVFAWQSGHRPLQRATTYGLDGAFPTQLQPALLHIYEWASTQWHEFLHQPSKASPATAVMPISRDNKSYSPPSNLLPRTIDSQPTKRKPLPWNQDEINTTRPAKRKPLPWNQGEIDATRPAKCRLLLWNQDEVGTTRPVERKALPWCLKVPVVEDAQPTQYQVPSTEPRNQTRSSARPPAQPKDIMAQIEAWENGAAEKPFSDDESESTIDWDEPDMIPSTAPADGSSPSWSREPWPSWSRHNARIAAKIDESRQIHNIFNIDELRPNEQRAIQRLKKLLDFWTHCCIICEFKGNREFGHLTQDCPDNLYSTVRVWAPSFLTRLQRLAHADTQSCPICLLPRLICSRWKQGAIKKWAETGSECQYNGIVVLTVVTALEGTVEIREELDCWMDSHSHSRNLDKVCDWLSGRSIGNDLCALRIIEVFQLVCCAWGRLNSRNEGYHCPRLSWITSIGSPSKADNEADEVAYMLREQKRQDDIERTSREICDWSGLDRRLDSWMEECPICYVRKKSGRTVNTEHKLEVCQDKKREMVIAEIAKLQGIEFAPDICCNRCAVPQETCSKSGQEENNCLYDGIVREAVAAIVVVGPATVHRKIYEWWQSEGLWSDKTVLRTETREINRKMLRWFAKKASWRSFRASVLIEVFSQLDQWIEASDRGEELKDRLRG